MIEKSQFFELACPTFILKLRQELATLKDKICKEGEDSSQLYFIKESKVIVLIKGEEE